MAGDKTHSEIEASLETDGRELLRLLLQDHVDNQGSGRVGNAVCGSDGVVRSHKRDHMETGYTSVFGAVRVARTGYSQRGVASLFPRDAQLNLPARGYSHGRSLQLGEGWHSSKHTVHFWNPLVLFQKETDTQCYASATAYAMMIPPYNACSARLKRPTHFQH
jgi:hypothetical protein